MHSSDRIIALGGKSKRESTREEVLNKAKAERAARTAAKQQQKAATVVQAAWRSQATRSSLCRDLLQQWQASYAGAAAKPDALVPGPELSHAVRLALGACLPLGSSRSQRVLASGQPLAQLHSCVKGTVALVLRSMSSSQPWDKYTAPAFSPDAQVRLSWLVQALQLCQLCCLVLSANSTVPDAILDAAAARLLQLLTSPATWGAPEAAASSSSSSTSSADDSIQAASSTPSPAAACNTSGACAGATTAAAATGLLAGLRSAPRPLLLAARRCVQQHRAQALKQQQQQQQQQQSLSPPAPLAEASMTATALQRVMGVVLALLERPQQQTSDQQLQGQQQPFAECVVQLLFTTPGLVPALPAAVKVRLLAPSVMCGQLLLTVQQLASRGDLAGLPAAHCLANLAQLLTGCLPGGSQQQQQQAAHSSSLTDARTATAYIAAAVQVLIAARRPARGQHSRQCLCDGPESSRPLAEVLQEGCWMLGTQQHLLPLLQTMQQASSSGMVLWAGYCCHLLQDAAGKAGSGQSLSSSTLNVLAFAPKLLPSLWDWLAHTVGLPLEAPLQASRGLDIAAVSRGPEGLPPPVALVMGLFCRSLAQLLLVVDDGDLHQRQTPFSIGASRAIASTLNSLVFHTAFPEQDGAQQQQQRPGQQLQRQAGALQEASAAVLPATLGHGMGLLREYAPFCLKHYFDKDARKPFCQPHLWTEPYNNLMARLSAQSQQDGGMLATTAAVVQALLVSTGLTGQEEEGGSGGGGRPASAASAQGGVSSSNSSVPRGPHLPGLRTSALLSLLKAAPQCVPFTVRLELFRQMMEQDKSRGRWGLSPVEGGPRPIKLTVRRDALLEDAYRGLAGLGQGLKGRLMVTFVNAQGLPEAGLDHGGLMKELLEQVVAAGTQPEYGLFATTEDTGLLYPNPTAEAIPQGLALLEFLGMMIGKALYEGILLNLSFAPFFIRCLQGGRPGLDDVSSLDATLHSNLLAVKACPPEQVEHLCLTFAAEQQLLGKTLQYDLLPKGGSIAVTASNRLLYVYLLADWHLNTRLGRAADAFASGLATMLPPSWLRLFSPGELNQLISGGLDTGVDVDDMARYVRYSNGYNESSHTVKLFWRVVRDMSADERCALLRFITSTSRAPLGGFKHLQPPLTIHKVECGASPLAFLGGADVDRLPSASTCFNTLKLPNYKRGATLKQKLLYAIGSGAGFELS